RFPAVLRPSRSEPFALRGPVDRTSTAFFIDVSEFSRSHAYSINRNCAFWPLSRVPDRRGIMINAFARESPTRSDDPFHGAVRIQYWPPSNLTNAGIRAARSGSHFAGASNFASRTFGAVFSALSKNRINGRTNMRKATIVEMGFQG